MGLDMYLNTAGENDELIYWRKANQIFKWFEDHCANGEIENCVPVPVTEYDLLQLLEDINAVLNDNSRAPELLPTQEGFFFGDTVYDEWYFKKLEYTRDKIESLLNEITEETELEFVAWW